MTCPESFRRRYLLHERDGFGPERFLGDVDHRTIAAALEEKMMGRLWDDKLLDSAFTYIWGDVLDHETDPVWGDTSPEKAEKCLRQGVHLYWDEVGSKLAPVSVESKMEQTIPGIPVPLIGYLDIETADEIIDRKGPKQKLSSPKPPWVFQARCYQLMIPKPVAWHITTRQVTPQLSMGESLTLPVGDPDRTVRILQRAWWEMQDSWARYGADEPWPLSGTLHPFMCGYCSYRSDCVAWS